MKKSYLISIILLLFILAGCSTEEETEPDPDEISEESYERIGSPPTITLRDKNYSSDDFEQIHMLLDKHCWENNAEDECNLTPSDPEKLSMERQGKPFLRAAPEDNIEFSMGPGAHEALYSPDNITLIHTSGTTEPEEFELKLNDFFIQHTAPKERGIHYYTLIFKWNNDEVKGEAIYAGSINVNK